MIVVRSLGLLSAGRRARRAFGPVQPPRPASGGAPFRLLQAPSADGLFRRTSQVRLNPPGYSGLRGEGSIPVPLPPPAWPKPSILCARMLVIKPSTSSDSDSSFGLLIGRVRPFFSEWLVSLQSSRLCGFGTVLEFRAFRDVYEF
jgi:hypothetical protein